MRPATISRRRILLGGTALALAGCGGSRSAADPSYDRKLPGPGDVDAKLSQLIPGKRMPAIYAMDPPTAVRGAAQPLVTIIEYSDFQCPFCGTLAQALHELLAAYPEELRIVFRQFPLPFHKQADPAARAALAAGRQQRFWAMHDELFANRANLADDALAGYASNIGLDGDQFARDFADDALASRVAAELEQGRALGVSGTPSMFINGFFVAGMLKPEKLTEVVDGERRVAQALMDAGSKRDEVYARFMRKAGAK